MHTLNEKIAVITGGNSGIGYATAREFKAQGAHVIITGRRKEAVDTAAAELGVTGYVADQASLADTEALVRDLTQRVGHVDILFINAGVLGLGPIEQATEAGYDQLMAINLKGAYFTLSRFIPLLREGASVVFLSSNVASTAMPGGASYAASKAALNSVMKTAALELAPRKIRVNAVSPGPTETSIMDKVAGFDQAAFPDFKAQLLTQIPLQRMGTAEDVAKMVAHLSGDAASFITGADILMDGGMVLA